MKKMIIFILIIIVLAIIAFFTLPWIIIAIGTTLKPNPSCPEITYGEFPFRLIYEINEKKIEVEDTLICEYDGIGMNEGQGKYRKWKEYLKSNNKEKAVLLLNDGARKLYCFIGSAEYYMNDEKYPEHRPLTPRVYMVKLDNKDTAIFIQQELLEIYKINLISWEFTEPITNSFK